MMSLCKLLSLAPFALVAVVDSAGFPLLTLTDSWLRSEANREELLLRNQGRTFRLLLQTQTFDDEPGRNLQTQTPAPAMGDMFCNADESVNFENDDYNKAVFGGSQFGTLCTCTEGTIYFFAVNMKHIQSQYRCFACLKITNYKSFTLMDFIHSFLRVNLVF
jgi:hypothetical protein